MSGICGIVRLDGKKVTKDEIQIMLDSMSNRGNDSEGIWVNENIGFGHKMLWTTPESLNESQPFISQDKNIVITADVRIDNRDELLHKLDLNKNESRLFTDVDLIVFAYQKWNRECVKELIGDFSFAIWDYKKEELFCARDHIGIKPFYYYISDQYFLFSSEIITFFTLQKVSKIPNKEIILQFLDNIAFEHSQTFYKNILRLPQASTLSLKSGQLNIERYWFPEVIKENTHLSFSDAKEKFFQLFKKAVKSRLRSAYPIGCDLSGGLDSTSVYILASEILGKEKILPFSKRYNNMDCDEGNYIEAVENQLNIQSNYLWSDKLDYKNKFSLKRFNEEYPGWPGNGLFLDSLAMKERIQEEKIRVLLTGHGGDHILSGSIYMLADYMKSFKILKLIKEVRANNFSKNEILTYIIRPSLPEKLVNTIKFFLTKLKSRKNIYQISHLDLMEEIAKNIQNNSYTQKEIIGSIFGMLNAQWVDNNPSQLNGRYNIEARHPFFDIRLIEFILTLPPHFLLQQGQTKYILRKTLCEKLPELIYNRNDKAEFSEAVIEQISIIDLEKFWKKSILVDFGLFSKNDIDNKICNYKSNKLKNLPSFWRLILVESWFRQNFN